MHACIGDVNASNSMWKAREVRRGGGVSVSVHALRCRGACGCARHFVLRNVDCLTQRTSKTSRSAISQLRGFAERGYRTARARYASLYRTPCATTCACLLRVRFRSSALRQRCAAHQRWGGWAGPAPPSGPRPAHAERVLCQGISGFVGYAWSERKAFVVALQALGPLCRPISLSRIAAT